MHISTTTQKHFEITEMCFDLFGTDYFEMEFKQSWSDHFLFATWC